MTVLLGIDIGLTGCIARLGPGLEPQLVDLPTVPDGEPRAGKGNRTFQPRRINGRLMLDLLRQLCPPGHEALVAFEDVRARPMHNDKQQFNTFHSQNSLVMSRGIIQAALDIAGFRGQAVQPQTWKAFYGLGGADKGDSRAMAQRLYPELVGQLRLVKDHNKAEALLIAHWAQRVLT